MPVIRSLITFSLILATVTLANAVTTFDDDVTPDVIFGSGNSNGLFTVDRSAGVEIGIRAKIPFVGTTNSNGDGTYSYTLAELLAAFPDQRWNFDWSVNTDWDGSSGLKIDDLTYRLDLDFDPGSGTDFVSFDPITPSGSVPFHDHSIGTNATPNGGGTEAGDAFTYAALIASGNVAQQSWRYSFFPVHPTLVYDPTIPGVYDVALNAFSGATLVASTTIQVIVNGEIGTSTLSENGWFSDDTRADGTGTESAGTNLISDTLTDDPEATASGTPAHDADIGGQISFGLAPGSTPAGTHPLAVHLNIGSSGSGKSQITHRKDDGVGHNPGSVLGSAFYAIYSWMGDGTPSVTASLKFGIKTADFGSTGVSTRTGENVWDKILIYEPGNLNGGTSDSTWKTETVSYTSGKWWFFDRTAGASIIGTPMTLSDMAGALGASTLVGGGPKTAKDVYDLMTAPGAHITSTQFGIGSGNAGGSVYVNQLETNAYRAGTLTIFGSCGDRFVSAAGSDVGNNCLLVGAPCATIQHAVDEACPGEIINVAAGTHAEGPQIVIDKDVSLVGAGKAATVLNTTGDTSSSGDARGWILVESGNTFHISDLTMDGSGFKVWQAIRQRGEGTVDNVHFTEIKFDESGPSYAGNAIAAFGTGPVDVTNSMFTEIGRIGVLYFGATVSGSVFDDNTYVGKGDGDFLDYMLDISSGVVMSASGNEVSDNRGVASSDGSTSAGLLVTTFFGAGTTAVLDGNLIEDNTSGIAIGFDSTDTSTVTATCNRFVGNAVAVGLVGADASGLSLTTNSIAGNTAGVDTASAVGGVALAEDNWWGSIDGPGGVGPGSGDTITTQVDADPFATLVPACVSCTSDAACDNGLACDGAETCNLSTNMCEAATPLDCSVLDDQCNTGSCVEPTGCVATPVPDDTLCIGDPDICAEDDTCQSGTCVDGGGGDSNGNGICDAQQEGSLTLSKFKSKENSKPSRDLWQIKGELSATTSVDFLGDLSANGVEVLLFKQAGGGLLAPVTSFSFLGSDCTEKNGSLKCKDLVTKSTLKFKKRSASDFFKVSGSFKLQEVEVLSPAVGPFEVSIRTFEQGEFLDRGDEIADCAGLPGKVQCKEKP